MFFFPPPGYVALWDSQTHQWEGFLVFGNFSSFMTPFPGWVFIPNSFSVFIFYIFSYLLSKRMGWVSGCLVPSASIQKLFCGIFSTFKWSFSEFVGEKVVSSSYSSAILGLPPFLKFWGKKKKKNNNVKKSHEEFVTLRK